VTLKIMFDLSQTELRPNYTMRASAIELMLLGVPPEAIPGWHDGPSALNRSPFGELSTRHPEVWISVVHTVVACTHAIKACYVIRPSECEEFVALVECNEDVEIRVIAKRADGIRQSTHGVMLIETRCVDWYLLLYS